MRKPYFLNNIRIVALIAAIIFCMFGFIVWRPTSSPIVPIPVTHESGANPSPILAPATLIQIPSPAFPIEPEQALVNLPEGIRDLIQRWRKSERADERDLAEILPTAWTNFASGVHLVKSRYQGEQAQTQVFSLFLIIHSETLKGFANDLTFIEDAKSREGIATSSAKKWCLSDPNAIWKIALNDLQGESKNSVLALVAQSFMKTQSFDSAREVVASMPFSSQRVALLRTLGSTWANTDPNAALDWAKTLQITEDRSTVERGVLDSSKISNDGLTKFANSTSNETLKSLAVNRLAARLVDSDLGAATTWASQMPEAYRDRIYRKIAVKTSDSDLAKGTKLALSISDPGSRLSSIDEITQNLVSKNPWESTQWMQLLPVEVQSRVAFNIVSQWYDINSLEASDWINALPAGELRDRALTVLSARLSSSGRAVAKDAATAIKDPKLREEILRER